MVSVFSSYLLAPVWSGIGALSLLFLLCFVGVHAANYAVRGWRFYARPSKKPTHPQEKPPAAPPATPPEPVYYIVEKKRRRSKPSYGEPREIRFR